MIEGKFKDAFIWCGNNKPLLELLEHQLLCFGYTVAVEGPGCKGTPDNLVHSIRVTQRGKLFRPSYTSLVVANKLDHESFIDLSFFASPEKLINIGGVDYYEDDLVKALSLLRPVGDI